MLFNSIVFIGFAFLFFFFYSFVKKLPLNFRWGYLTIASLIFYGWWDWRYISLLLLTGLIDFAAGLWIHRYPRFRKLLLLASLSSNLLVLIGFKYIFFIVSGVDNLIEWSGISLTAPSVPELFSVLPVGISFYTFQSMSYTVDVYRGSLSPTRNVLHFFAFLSLFPQLVAGPIVRAGDLLPQLKRVRNVSETERWHGLRLIALGYFKKTVLADNIAPFVNSAFSNDLHNTSSPYWWLVMIGFALQIYFDFSGYSDIARGLAKWMGIHFKVNFNHPYLATSFKNFWSRWHISLSTWFRDYIFIPLGGSRKGTARSYINLWITMLLSGLWHGAGLNYILWGGLHASYLTVEKVTNWPAALSRLKAGKLLAGVIVFLLTTMAWVFFRAPDISTGAYVIQHLFSFTNSGDWGVYDVRFTGIFFICLGVMMEISWALSTRFVRARETTLAIRSFEVVQVSLMVGASIFFRGTGAQFIYFQF